MESLKTLIVDVPDFPKPGIIFKDITPILNDFIAFQDAVMAMRKIVDLIDCHVDKIAGLEARGFFFAPTLALEFECGFIPIRKMGKLPREVHKETYSLEYNEDELHIHTDALKNGQNVVIVDDVLATGGTALAAAKLIERCGGEVVKIIFLIEIESLKGRQQLKGYDVESIIKY